MCVFAQGAGHALNRGREGEDTGKREKERRRKRQRQNEGGRGKARSEDRGKRARATNARTIIAEAFYHMDPTSFPESIQALLKERQRFPADKYTIA